MAKKQIKDSVSARGFFRLQVTEEGKVVGDSGWRKNQITDLGYQNFIVGSLGAIAASSQASYFALGTGTIPGNAATSLNGEMTDVAALRFTVTPSAVSSKTLQLTGSLASNVVTTTHNIANVGIFAVSTTNAGTLFAGNTYTSSLLNTNQNVRQLRFLLETISKNLREFGEKLIESIPSRALLREGVETMYEVTHRVKDIVRTTWRHVELGGNIPALAF